MASATMAVLGLEQKHTGVNATFNMVINRPIKANLQKFRTRKLDSIYIRDAAAQLAQLTSPQLFPHLLRRPSLPGVRVEEPQHEVREDTPRLLFLSNILGMLPAATAASSTGGARRCATVRPGKWITLDNIRDVVVLEVLFQNGHRQIGIARVLFL